jgi:glyoxylase-like metal-dependent hydrolase (beta-lactamase superfamily II)
MKITSIILGEYQTNCFCVTADDSAKDCLVVDTGLSPEPLIDHLQNSELNPVAVVYTHGHLDHTFGVKALRENWPDIKVAIHKDDADMLTNADKNLSAMMGMPLEFSAADIILNDGDEIDFAGVKLKVIHTPGHTPGGICLYSESEKLVFAGDTLFAASVGRTDFPGGDHELLITSIRTKLIVLPDETKVYTGHGPMTMIGQEKKFNPFIQ